MVNARWLTRQCIWSGRIGNLHISIAIFSVFLRGRCKRVRDQGKEDKEVRGDEPNKGGLYSDQYNFTKSKLTTASLVLLHSARSLP